MPRFTEACVESVERMFSPIVLHCDTLKSEER